MKIYEANEFMCCPICKELVLYYDNMEITNEALNWGYYCPKCGKDRTDDYITLTREEYKKNE